MGVDGDAIARPNAALGRVLKIGGHAVEWDLSKAS